MKQKNCIILVLALLLNVITVPSFAEDNITVNLNSTRVEFDSEPYVENDRVMVPFRSIAEAMGMEISWNEETQTVAAMQDEEKRFEMQVGKNEYKVYIMRACGKAMDAVPVIKNDRTYIPARFFCEALGADVEWNEEINAVNIKTYETVYAKEMKPYSFKEGRISFSLPEGEKNEEDDWSVFESDSLNQAFTLYIDVNDEKSCGDIEKDAKSSHRVIKGESYEIDGAEVLKIDPHDLQWEDGSFYGCRETLTGRGIIQNEYLVKAKDDTLFYVGFCFDTDDYAEQEEFAIKVINSMIIK